jgi:hypothetical protein
MSMRNTLDRYWNLAEAAPLGIDLQVQVTNGSGDFYVLPFPCRLTAGGWVNAVTGTALVVNPTYWKKHVETLPSRRGVDTKVEQVKHSRDGTGAAEVTQCE